MTAFIPLFFIFSLATPNEAGAILGQWLTEDHDAVFEITKSGEKYCGKIIWLKDPTFPPGDKEAGKPCRDRDNPDPAKRDQPIVGLCSLNDFEYTGKNTWSHGTIYNPDNGKTYKATLSLRDNHTLKVRGYVGISLLGGTTVWTRCEKPPDSPANETRPDKDKKN